MTRLDTSFPRLRSVNVILGTASSNFAGSRFAGKVFPDDNVLGSLLGNFLFGNSLTTYIVDVQMQHFGTELEVLEGIVCAETLRKVRLLQTSNFVDHRLQRSLAATKELKGEVGQLRNRLEEKEKLLSQASGKEEELRSRLQKMSLENESLCARVEDLENSLASSTKKADQHIGELTEKIARYKHDHKELLRDIGLKETKFQQEALELRSQLALAEEENRRLQTDDGELEAAGLIMGHFR